MIDEREQLLCRLCGRLKGRALRDGVCFQCGATPTVKAKVKALASLIVERGQCRETARALREEGDR